MAIFNSHVKLPEGIFQLWLQLSYNPYVLDKQYIYIVVYARHHHQYSHNIPGVIQSWLVSYSSHGYITFIVWLLAAILEI